MTTPHPFRHEAPLRIAPDHPAIPGHFPGNPVVPGVLLLDAVVDAAEQWLAGRLHVRGLRQAKFIAPLLPGQDARIGLSLDGDSLEFSVRRGEATVARGSMLVRRAAGA